MSAKDVDALMNKESGVSGVSGVSSDFRDLSAAAKEGNDRAQLALDMFSYQVKKTSVLMLPLWAVLTQLYSLPA